MCHIIKTDKLISIYLAYFYFIEKYGINCSHDSLYIKSIFHLQKNIGWLMDGDNLEIHLSMCLREHISQLFHDD
jgi:hypothetical protein